MQSPTPELDLEHPFSGLTRTADRERILIDILTLVWDSTLELPISLRESDGKEAAETGPVVIGSIQVTGAWPCTLAIAASAELAAVCAERFYGRPASELPEADVMDAWGELVNQIGGNLKALIAPPTHLSLPDVMAGHTFTYRVPRTRIINEMTFACVGGRLRMTVLRPEQA
jgi:chemotaxis protein CheX